jgi:hypothetical protein
MTASGVIEKRTILDKIIREAVKEERVAPCP